METEDYQIPESNPVEEEISKKDRAFMEMLTSIIENNISSKDLCVEFIEYTMNITHSTLYRKIKRLTGMSSRDYVMKRKMDHSLKLLDEGKNVSEAAYGCGFNDPGYFRKCFIRMYGILPSAYMRRLRKGENPSSILRRESDIELT